MEGKKNQKQESKVSQRTQIQQSKVFRKNQKQESKVSQRTQKQEPKVSHKNKEKDKETRKNNKISPNFDTTESSTATSGDDSIATENLNEEREHVLKFRKLADLRKSFEENVLKKLKKRGKKKKRLVSQAYADADAGLENEKTAQLKKATKQDEQTDGQKSKKTKDDYKSSSKLRKDEVWSDIFGYRSKLNPKPLDSSDTDLDVLEETKSSERDMTWLFRLSSDEDKDPLSYSKVRAEDSAARWTSLLWYFLWVGGRMPFHFHLDKTSDRSNQTIICKVQKNSCYFCTFVITSLFLIFVTAVSIVNLVLIVFVDDVEANPQNQIERHLLDNHMMTVIIFLAILTTASVSSVSVLINGKSIAKYVTLWVNTLDEFNLRWTTGFKAATQIYIVWFISLYLIQVIHFFLSSYSNTNPDPFIEGNNLLIAIVFRSFVPNVLVDPDTKTKIQSSAQLLYYGALIVCLNAYALYCSWNFVMIVVVFSIGIENIAREWNFRLGIILRKVNIKKNEVFLRIVKLTHGYRTMFEWHRKIIVLVQENSKVFCTILVTFYLAAAFSLAVELLELAIYIGSIGSDDFEFKSGGNDQDQLHSPKKKSNHFNYVCFYLSQTIGIFLFVSLFIAQAGIQVMSALSHITRHNYLNLTSRRQRNFLMSLSMSFSARKPNLMKAGRIFSIDRSFVFGFLAFFMFLFTIMIRIQHQKILSIPIIIQSSPDSNNFSVPLKETTTNGVAAVNDKNVESAIEYFNKSGIPIPTTPTPTTTIEPEICYPTPSFLLNTTLPEIVSLRLNSKNIYKLCCFEYSPISPVCHLIIPERNACKVPPKVGSQNEKNSACQDLPQAAGELCTTWISCMCDDIAFFTFSTFPTPKNLSLTSLVNITCILR